MRRLIELLRQGERGGVSVIVALSLVVLLGAAAIVIDTGALYAERAELQSGADASALAIAQDCADGSCVGPDATAQALADQNAKDGASDAALLSLTSTFVRVQTTTRDGATGAGSLALRFAPLVGIDSETVSATSAASWGSPAAGPAMLPLAFAPCVFDLDGGIQVIQTHGTGTPSCTSTSPSGQTLSGGFSWLGGSTGSCEVHVEIDGTVAGSTGTSAPSECASVLVPSLVGQTVLLPVYDDKSGTGDGATYHISGWAAFTIHGWRFPGNSVNNDTIAGATCTGSCQGIIGEFVTFTDLNDDFTTTTDPSANLGASLVFLTE